jgi:hypothetical protein
MFKKILVAVLAASLVVTPVQAKQECTKAFVGVDDVILIFISAWLFVKSINAIQREYERKQLEQEKAKQPAANSCQL